MALIVDGYPLYAAKAQPSDEPKYDVKVAQTQKIKEVIVNGNDVVHNTESNSLRRSQMMTTFRETLDVPKWFSDFDHYNKAIKVIVCKSIPTNSMTRKIREAELNNVWSSITNLVGPGHSFLITEYDDEAEQRKAVKIHYVSYETACQRSFCDNLRNSDTLITMSSVLYFISAKTNNSENPEKCEHPEDLKHGIILIANTAPSARLHTFFKEFAKAPESAGVCLHMFAIHPTDVDMTDRGDYNHTCLASLMNALLEQSRIQQEPLIRDTSGTVKTRMTINSYYCYYTRNQPELINVETQQQNKQNKRIFSMVTDRVFYRPIATSSGIPFQQFWMAPSIEGFLNSIRYRLEEIKFKINKETFGLNNTAIMIPYYLRLIQDIGYSVFLTFGQDAPPKDILLKQIPKENPQQETSPKDSSNNLIVKVAQLFQRTHIGEYLTCNLLNFVVRMLSTSKSVMLADLMSEYNLLTCYHTKNSVVASWTALQYSNTSPWNFIKRSSSNDYLTKCTNVNSESTDGNSVLIAESKNVNSIIDSECKTNNSINSVVSSEYSKWATSLIYNARHLDKKQKDGHVIFQVRHQDARLSKTTMMPVAELALSGVSNRVHDASTTIPLLPSFTAMHMTGHNNGNAFDDQRIREILCQAASEYKTDPPIESNNPLAVFCLYLRMCFQLFVHNHPMAIDYRRYCRILLDTLYCIGSENQNTTDDSVTVAVSTTTQNVKFYSLRQHLANASSFDSIKTFRVHDPKEGDKITVTCENERFLRDYMFRALIDLAYDPNSTKYNVVWYFMIASLDDESLTRNQARFLYPNESDLHAKITNCAESVHFVKYEDVDGDRHISKIPPLTTL